MKNKSSKWWKREKRKLWLKLLPRRIWCAMHLRHVWGEADPVIVDGPIDFAPCERVWTLLAFHKQCQRCYTVKDVGYTAEQAFSALEEAILEEQ